MTKEELSKELWDVLFERRKEWAEAGHNTMSEALRWWVAYTEAKAMVEMYKMKDWAHVVEDGIEPLPRTWKGLITHLYENEEMHDEGVYAEQLKKFYTRRG